MLTGRVAFGPFVADLASGELWRDGVAVPLQDLPFRLLAALLERPGELVTRAELTTRLWGTETFVDAAAGLNTAIAKLRDALGDNADQPAFIETVPKRGYRFVGEVTIPSEPSRRSSPERQASEGGASGVFSKRLPVIAAALIVLALASFAAFRLRANPAPARVAVVLFDNETGDPALGRLAQGITDATVIELTADARLAVIGNAAVLRTSRPFRDLAAIRDALDADYIVIGQVQARDGGTLVRAHLIRARDQAHVWVDAAPMAERSEAAFQAEVAGRIKAAVTAALSR
jgi:DNA-binding winged helix-turn-helix (wHTH) protein/TolB-like protein